MAISNQVEGLSAALRTPANTLQTILDTSLGVEDPVMMKESIRSASSWQ